MDNDMPSPVLSKEELRKEVHKYIIPKIVWGKELTTADRLLRNEWLKTFDIDLSVLKFYTNKNILFEIVNYAGNKEICFDMSIRWLYASKVDYLLFDLNFYKIIEDLKSVYCGLAGFTQRSRPPYHPAEKTRWQNEIWSAEVDPLYIKLMNSYDFAIDLDADTFENSYADAKKLFKFFKKYEIKFSVWCSGKKGFHFRIPYQEFSTIMGQFDAENNVEFCHALAQDLKDKLKLTKIDTVIYSASRYIKMPYTLDARNKRVIFPLSDEEFINFKDEYMTIEYCLKQPNLGYRGAYLNRKSNPEGFKKMVGTL
jgi:hypothetical protein